MDKQKVMEFAKQKLGENVRRAEVALASIVIELLEEQEGCVLVSEVVWKRILEPTEEMIATAKQPYYDVVDYHSLEEDVTAIYKAMITKAQEG